MSIDLGRKIQYLRLQSKESQEVMAQKLNVSRQAISKWENNVSAPDVAMLNKIANYMMMKSLTSPTMKTVTNLTKSK